MNEYEEQLRKVDRLKTIHHYADAIKEYGSLAEMALKQLHDGIYARLTPDEKLKLASVERQFGPKNPSETFTLGSWILFYQKSNLPDMLGKAHGIPASSIDVSGLSRIKEIRNKCVHNNYVGTPEESADAATLVEKLLLDFKLISTIPRNFVSPEPTGGDQEKDKVAELARKLRMVLSVEPLVEIGEAYFPDNDITINYWIEGKW